MKNNHSLFLPFNMALVLFAFSACFCGVPCLADTIAGQRENSEYSTALDHAKLSAEVEKLQTLVDIPPDETLLAAFPVLRNDEVETVKIAKEIGDSHLAAFGEALLGSARLNWIDEVIDRHRETASARIISNWVNRKGRTKKPVTSRVLINVLNEIGISELARKMMVTCELLKIIDVPFMPTLVKEYSQRLSRKIEGEFVIDNTQWLSRMYQGQNITLNFVALELKEEGTDILLHDIIGNLQSGTRILFLGRPGVGKTTITRHLAKELVFIDRFYLVVKIHLDLTGKIDSLNALLEANDNETFDSSEISVISEYLSKTLGEGVCFLLDGFDEYNLDVSDYVGSLIQGNKLEKSVVIMSSRPSGTEDIKAYFHRRVEIIGFGEGGVQAYLDQLDLSPTDNQTIHRFLDSRPSIRQLCYLPLHLSMLVYIAVVTEDKNTLSLVYTRTELYSDFLFLTVKQYELRHEHTVSTLQECFDDLHKETFLCVLLQNISKIAFESLMDFEHTFTSSTYELPEEIEALSLFKIVPYYDKRGSIVHRYYYSHPTFQEYLAGLYLTTFPREKQLVYTKHYWMHESYIYYLGLIGHELRVYDDDEVVEIFVSFSRKVLATYQDQEFYIMKCAHEVSRSFPFISLLQAAGVVTNSRSLSVEVSGNDSHDCWYVGHAMTQSHLHQLTIEDGFFQVEDTVFSKLALCISFINSYLSHYSEVVERVNVAKLAFGKYYDGHWPWFTRNEDPVSSAEIRQFIPTFENDLERLELTSLRLQDSESILLLGQTLKSFKKLQSLALSVNTTMISNGCLESALQELPYLEHVELGVINRHDDDTPIPGNLLEFKNLTNLKSFMLYISWNKDIVDVNVTALVGGLQHLTGLKILSIHMLLYSGLRYNGAAELVHGIKQASVLNLNLHLDLCWNNGIGNVTANELGMALKELIMLKNLSLCVDFNFSGMQGSNGLMELIEGLKHVIELQWLRLELRWELLERESIDTAAMALAEGLKHLQNLVVLELTLTQDGSCSKLGVTFKYLTQLQELQLKWRSPAGKTDVNTLLEELQHLEKLERLDLSWNDLDDENMVGLINALKCMSRLHTLDLSHNKIGDLGLQLLAETIESQYLTHLQVLVLSFNEFSAAGAKILAEKVQLLDMHVLDFGLDLGLYSAEALSHIYQGKVAKKPVHLAITEPNRTCTLMPHIAEFGISVVVAVLIGGILCHFCVLNCKASSLASPPIKKISNSKISKALAQGLFSASSAWRLERLRRLGLDGSGTVIVLLDTAVHKDFAAFHGKAIKIVDHLPNLRVLPFEHGTVCAAIAGGVSNHKDQSKIPSGVAPGAKLIVYPIADGDAGEDVSDLAVLTALDDIEIQVEKGAQIDVVSISYDFGEDIEDEVKKRICKLVGKGIVFVAAAGNRGRYQIRNSVPACFDSVISVGALDKCGYRSRFTSCGRIDVYAPGEDIELPLPSLVFRGTSLAAPAISGLVSLLIQLSSASGQYARDNIHNVCVLRHIFSKLMMFKSNDGQVDIFDPVKFFLENPNLNEIICKVLNPEEMMEL